MASYGWELQAMAGVSKAPAEGDDITCKPRLYLVSTEGRGFSSPVPKTVCLGYITYDVGGRHVGRARWLVYYYPLDSEGLSVQYDEGQFLRRVLEEGENREPRDTAQGAFDRLLELVSEEMNITGSHLEALRTIGSELLKPLILLSERYQRRMQRATASVR